MNSRDQQFDSGDDSELGRRRQRRWYDEAPLDAAASDHAEDVFASLRYLFDEPEPPSSRSRPTMPAPGGLEAERRWSIEDPQDEVTVKAQRMDIPANARRSNRPPVGAVDDDGRRAAPGGISAVTPLQRPRGKPASAPPERHARAERPRMILLPRPGAHPAPVVPRPPRLPMFPLTISMPVVTSKSDPPALEAPRAAAPVAPPAQASYGWRGHALTAGTALLASALLFAVLPARRAPSADLAGAPVSVAERGAQQDATTPVTVEGAPALSTSAVAPPAATLGELALATPPGAASALLPPKPRLEVRSTAPRPPPSGPPRIAPSPAPPMVAVAAPEMTGPVLVDEP